MALFLDAHPAYEFPVEAVRPYFRAAHGGQLDELGVKRVDLFCGSKGTVYCLVEAPHEGAVRDSHATLGLPCGDVHEVARLLRTGLDSLPVDEAWILAGLRAEPRETRSAVSESA